MIGIGQKLYYELSNLDENNEMQITGVIVLVGLSIILFEVLPEKSVWSIPVIERMYSLVR
jgi:hypothetical protein